MPFCIYCGREKEIDQFSDEHVIPKAIGGNLEPINLFLTDEVCNRCNNISGIFIDEPFIKSWFTQNNRADNAFQYINMDKDIILPLSYMGQFNDLSYEGKICEFWLGPTGDQIFHFHEPYPETEDVPPIVGVPTHAKRKQIDYGFAFIFVRSNNPQWHKPILCSFVNQFRKSVLYFGNGPTPKGGAFSDIPEELKELHEELKRRAVGTHSLSFTIGVDYGDRFMAKIALGIGAILLNDSFKQSESANILRQFMWTKSSEERSKIPLHGINFVNQIMNQELRDIFLWPSGHLIHILPHNDNLILYTNFYKRQEAAILISSEPEHWEGTVVDQEMGIVYVLSPSLQRIVGPKPLATYIAHMTEPDFIDEDLTTLESEMESNRDIAPFMI